MSSTLEWAYERDLEKAEQNRYKQANLLNIPLKLGENINTLVLLFENNKDKMSYEFGMKLERVIKELEPWRIK